MEQGKKRKRTRSEGSFAQNIKKIKRNIRQKAKLVSAKIFENKDCFYPKKCLDRIDYNERKSNFDNFWKLKHLNPRIYIYVLQFTND